MIDIWRSSYRWKKTIRNGKTYFQQRTIPFSEPTLDTRFMMYKNQKCTSGVTFQYIKGLTDIYNTSVMTGDDDYSVFNSYNEFDAIDKFMKNVKPVDIAVDYNVNLNNKQTRLDRVEIKTGHRILLFGQTDTTQNGIYSVDKNYKLVLTNDISTSEKSDKFKVWVKLGTYFDQQFFLVNNYDNYYTYNYEYKYTFPITGSSFVEDSVTYTNEKVFVTGHSYMIKNKFRYDLDSVDAKLIFTDIDIARKLQRSFDYYEATNTFTVQPTSDDHEFVITYKDQTDIIINNADVTDFVSYNARSGITATTEGDYFYAPYSDSFKEYLYTKFSSTNPPNIRIQLFYGDSTSDSDCFLDYTTTPKNHDNTDYFIPRESMPGYIIDFFNKTGGTYKLTNYSLWSGSGVSGMSTALNYSPMGRYVSLSGMSATQFKLIPKLDDNNKYFDYSEMLFSYSATTIQNYGFNRKTDPNYYNNKYVDYKLNDFLSSLSTTFGSLYNLWNTNMFITPAPVACTGGVLYISGLTSYDLMHFKPYTFVKIISSNVYDFVLIHEIGHNYIKLECPYNFSTGRLNTGTTLYAVYNQSDLGKISNLLYKHFYTKTAKSDFLGDTGVYVSSYRKYDDAVIRKVYNAYAEIICDSNVNTTIKDFATGIIYTDDEDNFILKIFSLTDPALTYKPVELIDIGMPSSPAKLKSRNVNIVESLITGLDTISDYSWLQTGYTIYTSVSGESYLYESKISDEYIYSFGQFKGYFVFGSQTGQSHGTASDYMILKTKTTGLERSFKTGYADGISGTGMTTNCLEVDMNGNYYVGGSFYGSNMYVLTGNSIVAETIVAEGDQTNYLLKYDRNDNYISYIKIATVSDSETVDIDIEYDIVDHETYLYAIGWYEDGGKISGITMPYSAVTVGDFGSEYATIPAPNIPIYPPSSKVDFSFDFYLGYNLSAETIATSDIYKNPRDNYIVKLDSDLNIIWYNNISSNGDAYISEVDIKGNFIYVTGQFNGYECWFGEPTTTGFVLYSNNRYNNVGTAYIAKLNKRTGAYVWVHKITTDSIESNYVTGNFSKYGNRGTNITVDDTGLYTVGWYKDLSRYEANGTGNFQQTSNPRNSDIYIVKTTESGIEQFHTSLRGNTIDDPLPGDQATDIYLDSGVAYVSGRFKNNIYLNFGGQLIGSGHRDSFVAKVNKTSGNVINKFAINCFNADSEVHLEDIMILDGYFYLSGHFRGSVLFDSTLKQSNTWHHYLWKRKNNL
jgi:hypothetical protein